MLGPLPALESLIICSTPLAQPARGRDAVDLTLASLALGWETGLLLCDSACEWLWAQHAPVGLADPFARTLASLPLYDLKVLYVLDEQARAWPALQAMPAQVIVGRDLPKVLRSAQRVWHP
jgi:sulfur relay (sulfurtransferase) DsrF/TusC family protein